MRPDGTGGGRAPGKKGAKADAIVASKRAQPPPDPTREKQAAGPPSRTPHRSTGRTKTSRQRPSPPRRHVDHRRGKNRRPNEAGAGSGPTAGTDTGVKRRRLPGTVPQKRKRGAIEGQKNLKGARAPPRRRPKTARAQLRLRGS